MLRNNRCRVIAAIISLSIITGVSQIDSTPEPAHAQTVSGRSSAPSLVKRVQYVLRSHGYGIAVDGIYGPQTIRAVKNWQRANGLLSDGILGPKTLASLGLTGSDTAHTQAAPTAPPEQPAPPATVGVSGDCNSYAPLLQKYGLPTAYFLRVMWRESRCDPTAYNPKHRDRSYGLLQINTKVTPRMNLWAELQRRCGLVSREQLFDPETNIACASQLFRVYGYRPWRVG